MRQGRSLRKTLWAAGLGLLVAFGAAPPAVHAQDGETDARFEAGLEALRAGRKEEAARIFTVLADETRSPAAAYNAACCFALLDLEDEAVRWLETALSRGFDDMELLERDPDLDPIRPSIRFQRFLRDRLGRAPAGPPLETLRGEPAPLERLRGQVVVLLLWRTASEPATKAAAEASMAVDGLRERGVVLLGVSPEEAEIQERAADRHRLLFPLLRQRGPLPPGIDEATAYPTLVILDREGKPVRRLVGLLGKDELLEVVHEVLEGKAPVPPKPPGPIDTF